MPKRAREIELLSYVYISRFSQDGENEE